MKNKILRGLLFFAIGYALLFTGKLVFNLTRSGEGEIFDNSPELFSALKQMGGQQNYMTEVRHFNSGMLQEQKFEKTSTITSSTSDFEQDRGSIFRLAGEMKAIIQSENEIGGDLTRDLRLTVGVKPDSFDAFVDVLKKTIQVDYYNIIKTDKTNEYMELINSRKSLLQTRDSLVALKRRSGDIEEFMNLEDKILEVERQIQALGVNLGLFDAEQSLCTVQISLSEKEKTPIDIIGNVIDAGSWAFFSCAAIIFVLLLAVLAIFLCIVVFEKARKYL
ncbi:MAG: DUF4349 domain-containing protein, partial [Spirochaetaceae bacterium]